MKTKFLGGPLAATLILAGGPAANAAEFTLLIYETQADIVLRADTGDAGSDYWAAYAAFGKKLEAAGVIRGGAPLVADPATVNPDGLVLGGYFRVDVATLAEAQAFAAQAPSAGRSGKAIAVGQVAVPGAMTAQ